MGLSNEAAPQQQLRVVARCTCEINRICLDPAQNLFFGIFHVAHF
jgi:hypothetical protein